MEGARYVYKLRASSSRIGRALSVVTFQDRPKQKLLWRGRLRIYL